MNALASRASAGLSLAPAAFPSAPPEPAPARTGRGVHIRGLTKAFGAKQVLRGIDLRIEPGQFVAIIGKSGCGKSTLLRLLAGLDRPTAGVIALEAGAAEGAGGAASTRIMFQEPRLLPWERVIDNVGVGVPGLPPRDEARAQARALLEEVGLAERADDWPSVLSGGQRQRVALARALASRPDVLALDEPLGALDALTRIEMQVLLERIWRQQGFTAVLVTHDVSEALALADRVVLIEDGRVGLDLAVPVERPRHRGAPALARLEGRILDQLFNGAPERRAGAA